MGYVPIRTQFDPVFPVGSLSRSANSKFWLPVNRNRAYLRPESSPSAAGAISSMWLQLPALHSVLRTRYYVTANPYKEMNSPIPGKCRYQLYVSMDVWVYTKQLEQKHIRKI